ncbi:MAG: threonine/serine exporter family protein [Spirochaetaceae bacterium]|nr:threonine/serine exporter family protein [Spirochaetaceae bacterium]
MRLYDFLVAALLGGGAAATLSFCSNISRYDIVWGAITGALGWCIYTVLIPDSGIVGIESFFWGALAVAVLSEILAVIVKNPATVYLIPGLLPLVPGGTMFQTMRAAVTGNLAQALPLGLFALTAAGAIALAVALSSSGARILGAMIHHFSSRSSKS